MISLTGDGGSLRKSATWIGSPCSVASPIASRQADVLVAQRRDHLVAHAVGRAQPELLRQLVEHVDRAGLGVGKLRRLGDDGGQHLSRDRASS